jgi:carbamoyltransferase
MRVFGIHDGHNASVALLQDGRVTWALQEERLNRVKNYDGFPTLAVKECLKSNGLSPSDFDAVALGSKHLPFPRTKEQLMEYFKGTSSPVGLAKELLKKTPIKKFHRQMRQKERHRLAVQAGFPESLIVFIDHHLAHATAAYWGSPFRDEPVLVLTCDGAGDDLCATVNTVDRAGNIKRIAGVHESHSLGMLYAMVTFAMGMVPNEHEYKLMGMAPYASRAATENSYSRFQDIFEFEKGGLTWQRRAGVPHMFNSYDFVRKLLELQRFDAVCAGIQKLTEEILVTWVGNAIKATGIKKVALSGGVFMNVKGNKLISEIGDLESLFVFPSCGDETNAIGAAFSVYATQCKQRGKSIDLEPLQDLYWGPEFSDDLIQEALVAHNGDSFRIEFLDDIETSLAKMLSEGKIVARMKGRMEFGARALGNRSILADASDVRVVRVINEMIKSRDFWMPFAPSLLEEREKDYVVNPKRVPSPYMIMSYDSTRAIDHFRAACHPYDLTVRPQVVIRAWNPDYHRLIERFQQLTGKGIVLNTSFNLHGSPIVCTPEDALDVFLNSGLEYLALGNFLISKKNASSRLP